MFRCSHVGGGRGRVESSEQRVFLGAPLLLLSLKTTRNFVDSVGFERIYSF